MERGGYTFNWLTSSLGGLAFPLTEIAIFRSAVVYSTDAVDGSLHGLPALDLALRADRAARSFHSTYEVEFPMMKWRTRRDSNSRPLPSEGKGPHLRERGRCSLTAASIALGDPASVW